MCEEVSSIGRQFHFLMVSGTKEWANADDLRYLVRKSLWSVVYN